MKAMLCFSPWMLLILLLVSVAPFAMAANQPDADVPALIQAAATKHVAEMRLLPKKAVFQLDEILVRQYLARGRIVSEQNARLKALYWRGATLLMNGFPIAGGTLISIARLDPAFPRSVVGPSLAHFVDAMLSPDDEDRDLLVLMNRAKVAQKVLQSLRPELRLVAQLRVIGEIYQDSIAVEAGSAGLRARHATPTELRKIRQALKA